MSFITNEHIENALGSKGSKKAKKRRTGGDSNDKGHEFEKAFTLNAILKEIKSCLEKKSTGRSVRFRSQPLGFVDDLAISREGAPTDYFELKSGETQRCTLTLKYNIARQRKLIIANAIRGRINLVLQRRLADDVEVVQRAEGIPISVIGFEEDILKDYALITKAVPNLPDSYKLVTLRILLLGAWWELGRNSSIAEIVMKWRYLACNEVRSLQPLGVSRELQTFFHEAGIVLTDELDVLRYRINKISGVFFFQIGSQRWLDFEKYLLHARPRDPMELDAIIDRFNDGSSKCA